MKKSNLGHPLRKHLALGPDLALYDYNRGLRHAHVRAYNVPVRELMLKMRISRAFSY